MRLSIFCASLNKSVAASPTTSSVNTLGYLPAISQLIKNGVQSMNCISSVNSTSSKTVMPGCAGAVAAKAGVDAWILLLGGIGIVIGLATYGVRVIRTVGQKITHLTPSRGFAAELAASSTIVVASGTGMPISTTQTLVGAVLGVGMARGLSAIDLGVVRSIFASWVITIPAGATLSIVFFFILKALFG